MKRNVKKLLVASLVIFMLGVVICSAALICAGASNVELFDNYNASTENSYEISLSDIQKVGALPFSKLKISAEKSDIRIIPTDEETRISFKNTDTTKTKSIIENGILKIDDSVPFYAMGLSFENGKVGFEGFRNVFSNGLYSHNEKSITIHLSQNDKPDLLEVFLGAGNVFVEGGEYDDINITSSFGNVMINNAKVSATAVISLKKGNIIVNDSDYVFLDASCTAGSADVDVRGRKTNCETVIGNIKVQTLKPLENYNIRTSLLRGTILLDGVKEQGKQYASSASDNPESIWLKTSAGDISLYNSVTNE